MDTFSLEFSIECPWSTNRTRLLREWFLRGLRALGNGILETLAEQAPASAHGEPIPVHLIGRPVVSLAVEPRKGADGPRKVIRYSAGGFEWFTEQLESDFSQVEFVSYTAAGPWSVEPPFFRIRAQVIPEEPKFLHLVASTSRADIESGETIGKWIDFARQQADVLDPIFGHDVADLEDFRTERERELRWFPFETVPNGRNNLRGYSWLTVCAPEAVARCGGIQALEASGAFFSVRKTITGGAFLLATERYSDYSPTVKKDVAAALRPVLFG